ncbi:MAG TPA: glycosyltransferase family 9 protein [Actinomycetota bacterium]|nr:glycosyltransferase family 9 protein [Actinomycetota bacterium]
MVLILRALGLGDFLTGVPSYRAVRNAFPGHRIVLAAPPALEPLARLTGSVDEVLASRPLERLAGRIRSPEVAVNLHGKGPQSTRILLELDPDRLVSFANAEVAETAGMPEWRPHEHEVHRWARLLNECSVPCDPTRLELDLSDVPAAPEVEGATVVHPGAAYGARRWPVERWAEVAASEVSQGRRVVVTGGPEERDLAERLAALAGLPSGDVLAGRTDLVSLAAVVARAGRVLCADTGVAHLATATRTPSVVLFGPTSPQRWGPPPDRPWHQALWHGSVGDPLGAEPDRGLLAITVDEVLAALERLPEKQKA